MTDLPFLRARLCRAARRRRLLGLKSPIAVNTSGRQSLFADAGTPAPVHGGAPHPPAPWQPAASSLAWIFALCQTTLATFFPGLAQDSWPSFRGDAMMSGATTAALPPDPKLLWSFACDGAIESTAAILAGVVYVGSVDGHFYAVDLNTGALKWKYDTGSAIKSSPLVADGAVFFGDEAGRFYRLNLADGSVGWTFAAEAGIISPAVHRGERLFFGSYDQRLYCVDRKTGEEIWRFETEGYVHASCPLVDSQILVAGCDGLLRMIDANTGRELKQVNLGSYAAASPAVLGNIAYLGTFGDEFLALDLQKGKVVWRYQEARHRFPFYASAAVLPDRVIVAGRDRSVRALDSSSGELLWSFAAGSKVDSSPVVVSAQVYVGTMGGMLLGLDLSSGEEEWRHAVGSPISASPAVVDGHLVIGAEDGLLHCFGGKPVE